MVNNRLVLFANEDGGFRDRQGRMYNAEGQRVDEYGAIVAEEQPQDQQGRIVQQPAGRTRTLGEHYRPDEFYANRAAIRPPTFQRSDFELKPAYFSLVAQHPFHGLPSEHPMDHIERFEDLASSIKANGVSSDYLYCKLFPYSLAGDAAYWLKQLAPGSLTTWEDTKNAFLVNFFDEARSEDLRMKIATFKQGPSETFRAAWMRLKSYQRDCPHHGFSDVQLLGIFFRGVDWRHQSALDAASRGNFNTNYPEDALALIENMASSSSTKNADFERLQLSRNMDGGQIAKMEAKLDNVHNLLVGKKSVQFATEVETFEPEEKDVSYINGTNYQRFGNQQGYQKTEFQKPPQSNSQSNYQRNYGSSSYQTPPPKTQESKMESMLEQILEGQQTMTVNLNGKMDAMYTDLNGKIEALNLHVKKLDTQVAQVAENAKRQEANPRLHVNAMGSEDEVLQGCGKDPEEVEDQGHEEEDEISPGRSLSIDRKDPCRSTRAEHRETGFLEERLSIDRGACRSTGCYAIGEFSNREASVDRHTEPVDRQATQNRPPASLSPPKVEERVYKPKLPFPREKSKQELEDAIMGKLVVAYPLIDAEKLLLVIRQCLQRMTIKNLSPEQFSAILSVELCALIEDTTPERPPQPSLRKLPKVSSPGMFVFPCSIQGTQFKNSLCDTGANVNVISEDVARKIGIVDLQPSRLSISLADGTPTPSKGFIADLMLQVGDCLVPTDFHVMESRRGSNRPLIFGRAFLTTVGAVVDFPNARISFSKINENVFYPAVHVTENSCWTVNIGGETKTIPTTAPHDATESARLKCKKVPPSTPLPSRSTGDSSATKAKPKRTSKPFSKFRIIIPLELREKGEEVLQAMVDNTVKLFPGVVSCTSPTS